MEIIIHYITSGVMWPDNSSLVLSDIVVWKWDIVDQTLSKNGLPFLSPLIKSSFKPENKNITYKKFTQV